MTDRWGFQPMARLQDGLPTWRWRAAPSGLVTRRQMRERGLAPGGAQPVAQIVCRRGRRRAWLYDPAELGPKRVASPAQLAAVAGATAARRWCPACRRDVGYCIPTSLGECIACHYPDTDTKNGSVAGNASNAGVSGAHGVVGVSGGQGSGAAA